MVGTIEQALDMKREKQSLEEMSDWEMKYLPKGIRIDIPLKSATHLLPVARILHEFAGAMERIARDRSLTSAQALEKSWMVARKLRREIEKICYPLRSNDGN
jgi:hypothetical protein